MNGLLVIYQSEAFWTLRNKVLLSGKYPGYKYDSLLTGKNGADGITWVIAKLVLMLILPAAVQAAHQLPVVNVAIVTDGPSERVASLRALFLEEMRAVNRGEF